MQRPIASRSVKGLLSLASKADYLDADEASVAKYLLKLAKWYGAAEYTTAKAKRMANKHKYQPNKGVA